MSHDHDHAHDDGHGHHELNFWQKYIFSLDHKVIGLQYGITALVFLFVGFTLMMLMRWQLAYPGQELLVLGMPVGKWIEALLGNARMPGGVMAPDFYNSLGAMHGTIMVFLAIVPLGVGAFGNYVMPLQIGAPDMAFPKLNMMSYHLNLWGGIVSFLSFFVPGGAAKSGWTSYPPLSVLQDSHLMNKTTDYLPVFNGQTIWLIGLIIIITSSLLGSVNFITTIVQLRVKGLTWMRLPFFTWAQFITSFLLLLAFPPLEAAAALQLMDRLAGTSFFLPSGLYVGGEVLGQFSGGGSPLLWQHLFWFLAHPEVYVLILPALGIVSEVITTNARKPLWGYRTMVFAIMALGFLSFGVWAHHMYLTGMGTKISAFFQTTTTLISIPSVIVVSCLVITLWGGSIRFPTAMLFATAFLPMFGIGGLTGIPLAFNAIDLYLHDTYYVIGHFHYVVAPGTIFAVFAGIYHWYPKYTGRMMNEFLGKLHFWPSLICMNVIFMPMFLQGMAGMHRRWADGGGTIAAPTYELTQSVLHWNVVISWGAWLLAIAQIPFIVNFFWSMFAGKKAESDNPWHATTLEWEAPNLPPHGNFLKEPVVYRAPYEYSVPGHPVDYYPQGEAPHGDDAVLKPDTQLVK
jgi:cytochrome c oxidase subunit 1